VKSSRLIAEQAPFVDIRVIGEFGEAEWVVEPGDGRSAEPDSSP
jgi:hypothetical protein